MVIAIAFTFAAVMLVGANYLVRKNQKPTTGAGRTCSPAGARTTCGWSGRSAA